MTLNVTGIFENESLAEDAQLYLLGNGFITGEDAESEPGLKSSAARNGNIVVLTMQTALEAQEGEDVLSNHGAINITTVISDNS